MTVVKVHEAKTNLSKLIALAEAGEEIIIARGDEPVVRLTPLNKIKKPGRKPGILKHLAGSIPDDFFFDPLPEEELKFWEGGD